ncbi:MAG TPA: fasciclin domain-containing protein [Bacteroides sp.]|nr:fasciclin domain-containing protein [Bacteroides sp.]
MKTTKVFSILISLSLIITACTGGGSGETATQESTIKTHGQAGVMDKDSKKNILQIAATSDAHTTLAAACTAAELLDVLANAGPLTVFAPTNAAFEKLPAGTVEDLLKPENKETLATIIKFHAAPGNYKVGKGLKDGVQLYMATGHYLDVEVKEDGTYVNGSKIIASIDATNGVVHVIEDVFLPPAEE